MLIIKEYFNKIIYLLLTLYLMLVLFLPSFIEILFSSSYHNDYELIAILSMGFVFLNIRKVFSIVLAYYEKSLWFSLSGYLPALLNVGLNFIFIPTYGIYAAAWTTLISFTIYGIIVFIMSQILFKISFDYKKLFYIFFLSIIVTFLSFVYNSLIINVLMFVIFLFVGYLQKFLVLEKGLFEKVIKKN